MGSPKPKAPYIVVDGACENNPGPCEYKGVMIEEHNKMLKIIPLFKQGVFQAGTNNLVEFLAVVHALAHCEKNNLDLKVYSDSTTAMAWVRNRAMKTTVKWSPENKPLRDLCARAIIWLNDHPTAYEKVMKWETKHWGENPADFGNKR